MASTITNCKFPSLPHRQSLDYRRCAASVPVLRSLPFLGTARAVRRRSRIGKLDPFL